MTADLPTFSGRIRRRLAIDTAKRADGERIGPEVGSLAGWLLSANDPRFIRGHGPRSAWRRKLRYGARLRVALEYARRHEMSTSELAAHFNGVGFPALNGRLHPVRGVEWTPELVAWAMYWCLPRDRLSAAQRAAARRRRGAQGELLTGEFP